MIFLNVRRFLIHSLLLMLVAAAAQAFNPARPLQFNHWMSPDSPDKNHIGSVHTILQDPEGFMWFGGSTGLARFNGMHFEIFRSDGTSPNSLKDNYVWDMLIDSAGRFWIATDKGLSQFIWATDAFKNYQLPGQILHTTAIAENPAGGIWVGGNNGLFSMPAEGEQLIPEVQLGNIFIKKLLATSSTSLWIGTGTHGLIHYNPASGEIIPVTDGIAPDVQALVLDKAGHLWIGCFGRGLLKYHLETQQMTHYTQANGQLQSDYIWDLRVDAKNNIWIATEGGGLQYLDTREERFYAYQADPADRTTLRSSKVRSLYQDALGDVWAGLFPRGIDHFSQFSSHFHSLTQGSKGTGLTHSSVIALAASRAKNKPGIWVGTEDGLNLFNPETQTVHQIKPAPKSPTGLQTPAVILVKPIDDTFLWVASWGAGLHRFNMHTETFEFFKPEPSKFNALNNSKVWTLLNDQQGTWVGAETGGMHLLTPDGQWQRFLSDNPLSLSENHVSSLLKTRSGRLLAGTFDGLTEFLPERQQFVPLLRDAAGDNVYGDIILDILEDKNGNIWFGTRDKGATKYNLDTQETQHFTTAQGLTSNQISGMLEDNEGYLWLAGPAGLSRIDPADGSVLNLEARHGLVGDNFYRKAVYKDDAGILYFGAAEGLTYFDPKAIKPDISPPPEVVITAIKIHSKKIPFAPKRGQAAANADALLLGHRDSMLTVEFSALSFRAPQLNQYAYKLVGFDENWNWIGNNNSATYTNLPPGEYEFLVRASNSFGIWNQEPTRLRLEVKAAPWASFWAQCAYAIILVGLAVYFWNLQKKRIELEQARAVNDKLKQLDKLKDAFLANTSHELRTPLNGIIGLADTLLEGSQGPLTDGLRHTLKMIANSGRRLSYLINDILDFSKLSKRNLDLSIKPLAVKPIVESVCELLAPLLGDKRLQLINQLPEDLPCVLADPNRLQQVLLNLVGNAIKFTESGSITLWAQLKEATLELHIKDTGRGIHPDDMAKLFVEFSQLDNQDTREQGGTGLGLAISRQLVELQGGSLSVTSNPGVGSDFYFSLPTTHEEPAVSDDRHPVNPLFHAPDLVDREREKCGDFLVNPSDVMGRYKILVVDDDAINRMVLSSMLKLHKHQVVEANSGQKALEIVLNDTSIDLVLLDVMMPGMSGYETAMRMRVKYQAQHLPILFLTAKNFSDDLVRGFIAGGNDFLTKPVAKQELLTRVTSHLRLLQSHRDLQEIIKNKTEETVATQVELQALDKIISSLNREMNPDTLLRTLLNQILLLVDSASGASLWRLDTAAKKICPTIQTTSHSLVGEACIFVDDEFIQHFQALMAQPRPVCVLSDFESTPLACLGRLFARPENTLLVTINSGADLSGFIALTHESSMPHVNAGVLAALNRIKGHATSIMLKAELMRHSGL
jgi:two-component system, sensor histidine kinase ChiS